MMKKILYSLLLMLLFGITAQAQETSEQQLPFGVTVVNDTVYVNWQDYLSVAENKQALVAQLQKQGFMADSLNQGITEIGLAESPVATKAQDGRKRMAPSMITCYVKRSFYYSSIDGKNNPINLSGVMYIPRAFQMKITTKIGFWGAGIGNLIGLIADGFVALWTTVFGSEINYGILNCHPTVTSNYEAPSGAYPVDQDVAMFCSDRALVVCPDYCGYGLTTYKQHPYLVQGVTARNCMDCYLQALNIVDNQLKYSRVKDFYTVFMGYSQGGSVSLACQKYYESGLLATSDSTKINLKYSVCGDGPYSPPATVKQYIDWANYPDDAHNHLAYPCVLPLIMQAAKNSYDNDCMRTVKVEDYFTPEFLATGILADLKAKTVTTEQLNAKTKNAGIYRIDQMLSDKIIKKDTVVEDGVTKVKIVADTTTNEYRCLMRALAMNDLTVGWTPKHPISFMHYKEDLVVPYCNTQEAIKMMEETGAQYKYFDPWLVYDNVKNDSQFWRFATWLKNCFQDPNHASMGTFFYIAAADHNFEW